MWQEYAWLCEELPNLLPKWLHHFASPPAMDEGSQCSTASPAFGIVSVLVLAILTGVW
jgi:hypothetical protein